MARARGRRRRVGMFRRPAALPAAMVEDAVALAGRSFVLHGRDPRYDMEIRQNRTYFGAGSANVLTLDMNTGKYRETQLFDIYDTVRLISVPGACGSHADR